MRNGLQGIEAGGETGRSEASEWKMAFRTFGINGLSKADGWMAMEDEGI